jgi:hypothetical protein
LILTSVQIGEGRLGRTFVPDVTPSRGHIPMIHLRHGRGSATSNNWSGYAVTGPNGSVSDVKASWYVPKVSCPASPNQYASFWVGIDGYSSNTVEQIGTDSDCQNGKAVYYVWYEFYPHWAYTVNTVPINPNDIVFAEVSVTRGTFTVSLTNQTTGKSFHTSQKMNNADRSSAEWIAEAPWSGGVTPLASFGSAQFGDYYTHVQGTSSATVNGITANLGSFANNVAITMVDKNGLTKAQPSSLFNGSSFSIDWFRAGP